MLAKGTSPILVLPIILFLVCFMLYLLVWAHPVIVLLALIFFLLSVIGLNFFRDPYRKIAKGIVASADGTVTFVRTVNGKVTVSIFMNVHNVHVNRAPLDGTVKRVMHRPGGHVPAYKKESKRNEQVVTDLRTHIGPVRIVQIAGIVARRIIPYIEKGDELVKGQRIGIIRLGSRVDVTFPSEKVRITIKKGEKVLAGATSIGRVRGGKGKEKDKKNKKK